MTKKQKNNKDNFNPMKNIGSNIIIWILIVVMCITALQIFSSDSNSQEITTAKFKEYLNSGQIKSIDAVGDNSNGFSIKGELKESSRSSDRDLPGKHFSTQLSEITDSVESQWQQKGVDYNVSRHQDGFFEFIAWIGPWLLIIFFWFFIMRRMQGGGGQNGIFSFAKSRAKVISPDKPSTTFDDVAGCDEAKVELQEIVEFLKKPLRYRKIGAKIPRGALLLGPPGTGKTLLAKAVSGEAGVPFFTISGAEFVEMFVGVGASRVRDLFSQAKRNSPSIIFIDEIDAVGRHRGAGLGGGHDEREQTLNQILVEMDGFETDDNVILIAATNRPDVLDKALLRPGRFDRQIVVDVPSVDGREAILKIHTKKIPLDETVDLKVIARGTPGLAGADLENLVNESALFAARRSKKNVSMSDFEDAKDKVMMGVERKSMILTPEDKKIISYHEAGHALVAYYTKEADPVHKITIIPRGRALGLTAQLPEVEKFNYSRSYLLAKLDVLMGGRSAEKLIFKDTSTGAGNDISVATDIARKMVTEWGMCDKIGPLTFGKKNEEVFLGKEISHSRDYSDKVSTAIDENITLFVKDAEKRADDILLKHADDLHNVAKALLEFESISGSDMEKIIKGEKIVKLDSEDSEKKASRRRSSENKSSSENNN